VIIFLIISILHFINTYDATVSTKGEYNLHAARANKPKNIAIMGTVFSISDKEKCQTQVEEPKYKGF